MVPQSKKNLRVFFQSASEGWWGFGCRRGSDSLEGSCEGASELAEGSLSLRGQVGEVLGGGERVEVRFDDDEAGSAVDAGCSKGVRSSDAGGFGISESVPRECNTSDRLLKEEEIQVDRDEESRKFWQISIQIILTVRDVQACRRDLKKLHGVEGEKSRNRFSQRNRVCELAPASNAHLRRTI